MKEILFPYVEEQMKKLETAEYRIPVSGKAVSVFAESLYQAGCFMLDSTYTKFLSDEASPEENLLATMDPRFFTAEQETAAKTRVLEKLRSGEIELPEALIRALRQVLSNRTEAFQEMLCRIADHKEEIRRCLPDSRNFTKITDLMIGAGDPHRHGRSVCVVDTDAGKFVYKPRDMRGEVFCGKLLERYLSGMVCVPYALAFDDSFGVSAFAEKKRASGEEEARLFYRNFGGLAAFLKSFGSTDMHVENISCAGVCPTVLDMETILSPVYRIGGQSEETPEEFLKKRNSVYYTTLIPKAGEQGASLSPLLNCTESGCAPEINGKTMNVLPYLEVFEEGFHEIYQKLLLEREVLIRELKSAAPELTVRVLLANSRNYAESMKKVFSYPVLSSSESDEQKRKKMLGEMSRFSSDEELPILKETLIQLFRGDIPFFYLYADSRDLLSDGKTAAASFCLLSPVDHAVQILSQMGDSDEHLERQLIRSHAGS